MKGYVMGAHKVVILFLVIRMHMISPKPDCPDREEVFNAQPKDIVIRCGSDESVEFRCQHTLGNEVRPVWIINSSSYGYGPGYVDFLNHSNHDITLNGSIISVKDVLKQNNTVYQCQLEVDHLGMPCTYKSTIGRLILKGCSAPDVRCSAHYDYMNATLIDISTDVKIMSDSKDYPTCVITYSDILSDEVCNTVAIPTSSCMGGVCSHKFNISSKKSRCSKSLSIAVTVEAKSTKNRSIIRCKPHIIDTVNHFIKISFNEVTSSISLMFINQPIASKKYYMVHYGTWTPDGCENVPANTMEGYLSNSNLVSLQLHYHLKQGLADCFLAVVNNGTKTVNVTGVYRTALTDPSSSSEVPHISIIISAIVTVLICGILVLFTLAFLLWMHCKLIHIKGQALDELTMSENTDGKLEMAFDRKAMKEKATNSKSEYGKTDKAFDREVQEEATNELRSLDKPTTYSAVYTVPEACKMETFAKLYNHKNYHPMKGFGYYEFDKPVDTIDPSWNVILTNKNHEPEYSGLGIAVKHAQDKTWSFVYIQSKSVTTDLAAGSRFLYCAYSELVIAYSEEYDVSETCGELEFVMDNIPGYQAEWERYGYFEFKKRVQYIKPHQKVLVKKRNGNLMKGAGIRHLVDPIMRGDGSQLVQPPDLNNHPEWERVFVQSRDLNNRTLQAGSKYLFCAMFDRVRTTVHYEVYDIYRPCNMAEFARSRIPGFKPELGYGYYEFKQEEYLQPEKKVVLADKKKRLFTGAGARFFCTRGGYNSDDIRQKKYSPPNLDGTQWEHIFIQSHSSARELQPGSKFLYFEYQTHK